MFKKKNALQGKILGNDLEATRSWLAFLTVLWVVMFSQVMASLTEALTPTPSWFHFF